MKYKLYDYDVYGNNKDGYEVNNIYPALIGHNLFNAKEVIINLTKNTPDKKIIKALKKSNWLRKTTKDSCFIIEGDFDYTLYISYSTKKYFIPVCELRLQEN